MNLNKTRTATVMDFEFVLKGDGTLAPELQVQQHTSYVDSKDLRAIGNIFLTWAEKLERHEAKEAVAS